MYLGGAWVVRRNALVSVGRIEDVGEDGVGGGLKGLLLRGKQHLMLRIGEENGGLKVG